MTAVKNNARALWNGDLFTGSGTVELVSSGAATFDVNFKARSEDGAKGPVTTPEELIAAAHASCYAMAFSNALKENGTAPVSLDVSAEVVFENVTITTSTLTVVAEVPGIDADKLREVAEAAKEGCPVSKALAGVEIILADATLKA